MKLCCENCGFIFHMSKKNVQLCFQDPYCPKCGKLYVKGVILDEF